MAFPVPVNVATALIRDVLPTAVAGNEKAPGSTVNCNGAGGSAAPGVAELALDDDGVVTSGATGSGCRLQAAVNGIHGSITAIESQ
jgi:hypothetical protein